MNSSSGSVNAMERDNTDSSIFIDQWILEIVKGYLKMV